MTKPKTYRPASGTLSYRKVGSVVKPDSGATILPKTKICNKCNKRKKSCYFQLRNSGKYLSPYCTKCKRTINLDDYYSNKKRRIAVSKIWKYRNKQLVKEYNKSYRYNNKDRLRYLFEKWYNDNKLYHLILKQIQSLSLDTVYVRAKLRSNGICASPFEESVKRLTIQSQRFVSEFNKELTK